ncbi:MAG TPA: hypothetical protein V6C88_17335 [Chroococcidiopsis sp.]
MGLLTRLASRWSRSNAQPGVGNPPAGGQITPSGASQPQPVPPASPPRKTLTQLEQELEAQSQVLRTYRHQPSTPSPRRRGGVVKKVMWTAILLGLPVGIVWFANLPYAPIRGPVARTAPILLLPSYMSIDSNFRQAIALVEQADQLISNPTSAADIDLGGQLVEQAQEKLDKLPVGFLYDHPYYDYWWYTSRFSVGSFNAARARVGELQAKTFQEKNAQNALFTAEQALTTAKQQYQQATTSGDKLLAVQQWRAALDQFQQISGQTLAGKTAQQKFVAYERDFKEIVGLAAGNEQVAIQIEAAKGFAREAAQLSQNPPHSVAHWTEVIGLWQEAISILERIQPTDPEGFSVAQESLATYKANVAQIRIRLASEQEAVQKFETAQREIQALNARTNPSTTEVVSSIQGILYLLNEIQDGTTVYKDAEVLRIYATNRLNELQPQ